MGHTVTTCLSQAVIDRTHTKRTLRGLRRTLFTQNIPLTATECFFEQCSQCHHSNDSVRGGNRQQASTAEGMIMSFRVWKNFTAAGLENYGLLERSQVVEKDISHKPLLKVISRSGAERFLDGILDSFLMIQTEPDRQFFQKSLPIKDHLGMLI